MPDSRDRPVWQRPLDLAALGPDNPAIQQAVDDRWRRGDFAVSASEADFGLIKALQSGYAASGTTGDPLGVEMHRRVYLGVWPAGGPLVVPPANLNIGRADQPKYKELTRQVRLAALASANDAVYGRRAGGALDAANLLRLYSEHWGRVWLREILPWTRLIDSFHSDGDFPCDWGNLAAFSAQAEAESGVLLNPLATIMRSQAPRPWAMTYLAIELNHTVPQLIVARRSDDDLTPGRGAVALAIGPEFDRLFRVIAADDQAEAVADFFSPEVQGGLVDLLPSGRIVVGNSSVCFVDRLPARFDQASVWQSIWARRDFVRRVWYPRLGEYVAGTTPAPPGSPAEAPASLLAGQEDKTPLPDDPNLSGFVPEPARAVVPEPDVQPVVPPPTTPEPLTLLRVKRHVGWPEILLGAVAVLGFVGYLAFTWLPAGPRHPGLVKVALIALVVWLAALVVGLTLLLVRARKRTKPPNLR